MNGRLLGSALLLLGLVGFTLTGFAGDKAPEKLVWKAFDGTKPFYQVVKTETNQTLKAMTQETKQTQTQTFYFSYEPKGKDGDAFKVEQKIIGLKMEMEIGGNKITYDSMATDKANNPMKEFFKTLESAKFVLKINPKDLKVEAVDGVKDFVNKLSAVSPAMQPVLNKILSDDAIKQMASPMLGVLPPGGEIPKDKKWDRSESLNLGPIGTYGSKHAFEFKEDKDNKVKIDVNSVLSYTKPDDKEATPFPFKIKSANLKKSDSKGNIVFDRASGRVANSEIKTNLELDVEVEIANVTTLVNVDQRQTVTLTTQDDDPTKAKK